MQKLAQVLTLLPASCSLSRPASLQRKRVMKYVEVQSGLRPVAGTAAPDATVKNAPRRKLRKPAGKRNK
jgi:hypothetical protein